MGVLRVRGGRPLRGSISVPGDKSISHRALVLGALASGVTTIDGLSRCRDVRRSEACVRALGVAIPCGHGRSVTVHGRGPAGLAGPPAALFCGDSGTTMRLLAGVLAGQDREFTLDGAAGLRRRPMMRVVLPLRAMGARLTAGRDGFPPIRGEGRRLCGATLELEQASAQVGSALLLAGLNAVGVTTVAYPRPVRDHTERMLAAMGAPISWDRRESRLDGPVDVLSPPPGGRLEVPGDLSSAAFLLAAATIVPSSKVTLPGVGLNPGRTGILDVLAAMGAAVEIVDRRVTSGGEPLGTVVAEHGRLRAADVRGDLVPKAIDELPLVAVLGARARGRTVVADAAELRVKESDRITAIMEGLGRLGARLTPMPDGFCVDGPTSLRGARVNGHEDHRVVMALAVAGLVAEGVTEITGASRVDDSYPGFVEALRDLGADVAIVP